MQRLLAVIKGNHKRMNFSSRGHAGAGERNFRNGLSEGREEKKELVRGGGGPTKLRGKSSDRGALEDKGKGTACPAGCTRMGGKGAKERAFINRKGEEKGLEMNSGDYEGTLEAKREKLVSETGKKRREKGFAMERRMPKQQVPVTETGGGGR